MQSVKLFLSLGAINAGLAVLLGAFGAHALKTRLTQEMLNVYQTGVHYHFYHALGLILTGILLQVLPASSLIKSAGWCMVAGIILFSGSLYLLSIYGFKWLGPVTPLGGTAFIVAWILLFTGIIRSSIP
ncbi:MAG TPA: DUF423 domain-containing protein [Gammaproteobacteria bacterium]|nr:DUF423 domain-containing protein [Gammaproteobacteria bacterium]